MSRWVTRFIAIALVFNLAVTGIATPILANEQNSGSSKPYDRPDNYILWEMLTGFLAGAVTSKDVNDYLINSYCKDSKTEKDFQFCRAAFLSFYAAPVLYPLLVFGGSSIGIYGMGMLHNVQGNLFAMLIGTLSGSVTGTVVAATFVKNVIEYLLAPDTVQKITEAPETPEYIKRLLPYGVDFLRKYEKQLKELPFVYIPAILAAVWGSLGYNVGAAIPAKSK
ncbi:hypothetical protein HY229_04990 [Candidatus Acetothermia bacterium]|nr:hypothetical protein [Candidatus Acetothermia bacterium]MBI3643441.1 hypothetical protein [Candidatus Acetothermia bacterium]